MQVARGPAVGENDRYAVHIFLYLFYIIYIYIYVYIYTYIYNRVFAKTWFDPCRWRGGQQSGTTIATPSSRAVRRLVIPDRNKDRKREKEREKERKREVHGEKQRQRWGERMRERERGEREPPSRAVRRLVIRRPIFKLLLFLKLTRTGPFAAWFVVTGDATPDGIEPLW